MEPLDNHELYQDLVHNFVQQKKQVKEELRSLGPVCDRLRPSLWLRIGTSVVLFLVRLCLYLLALASLLVAVLFDRIYPFPYLVNMLRSEHAQADPQMPNVCYWVIRGTFGLLALLFWFAAYLVKQRARQNQVILKTGKELKIILGQLMERKADMEILQQKHLMQLPADEDYEGFVVLPGEKHDITKDGDVPL